MRDFFYSHRGKIALLLLLGLAGATFWVSRLIKTKQERIAELIRLTARRLEKKDVVGAASLLAADFGQEGLNRAQVAIRIRQILKELGPPEILIYQMRIKTRGNEATCMVRVMAGFPGEDPRRSRWGHSRWELVLRKISGRWRVVWIRPAQLGNYTPRGLASLLKKAPHGL